MTQATVFDLVDARWEAGRKTLAATLVLVLGSLVLAASAQTRVFLPGQLAPITLQTVVVSLLGLVFGARLAAATCTLYLVECLAFPGFSATGGNLMVSGGFLLGFAPAAAIAGGLYRLGWGRDLVRATLAMTVAHATMLAVGTLWLATFVLPLDEAFRFGFLAFAGVEAIKIALSIGVMRGVSQVAGHLERRGA
ncbi:MAG: biotin transporter BioY [Planctomycetota bacterium]